MTNSRTLKNMKKALFRAIAVATLAILPATAQAIPITGTLDLVGRVRVTATTIDWLPLTPPLVGDALILGATDYFSGLEGTTANELDLVGLPIGVQLGAGVPDFETFNAAPGLSFILDTILSCGQASLNPVAECDGGLGSAFLFAEDNQGTTVIINFSGRVVDTNNPGEEATFTAKFDATFLGQTPAMILNTIFGVGQPGFIISPYSAQKIVVDVVPPPPIIPEPATLLTFGAGTALFAAHRRRQAKKAIKQ
jgi:hypothetical protein